MSQQKLEPKKTSITNEEAKKFAAVITTIYVTDLSEVEIGEGKTLGDLAFTWMFGGHFDADYDEMAKLLRAVIAKTPMLKDIYDRS